MKLAGYSTVRDARDTDTTPRVLGQLVEKQHAVMRKAYLTRVRVSSAARQRDAACRVVRRTERARRDYTDALVEYAGDGMYLGRFERFLLGHIGQYRRYALCEHGLAAARRTYHQNIMSACRRYLERALGEQLTFYVL